jgi:CIC family chloride channel protein
LVVGTIGLLVPQALSGSYGVIQGALGGHTAMTLLLVVALAKIATTSFTISSGGSGGVFGPSMVIGGAIGGFTGLVLHRLMPGLVPHPGAFVIVGMAGFFAGVANTPLSTVIMVSEMTGNYALLVPSMWVCTIAFLVLRHQTIYEEQVPTRADAPDHLDEMVRSVLQYLKVSDVLALRPVRRPVSVHETATLEEVLETFEKVEASCLPVTGAGGVVASAIHLDAVQKVLGEGKIGNLIIARDLSVPAVTVATGMSVEEALRAMVAQERREALVVGPPGGPAFVDVLTSIDIHRAYQDHMSPDPLHLASEPFPDSVFLKWLGSWRERQ